MKRIKLTLVAALALGLLFCMNDATAQQAVKKVNTQKLKPNMKRVTKKGKTMVIHTNIKPMKGKLTQLPKVTSKKREQ